jgi:hypothetical protein
MQLCSQPRPMLGPSNFTDLEGRSAMKVGVIFWVFVRVVIDSLA